MGLWLVVMLGAGLLMSTWQTVAAAGVQRQGDVRAGQAKSEAERCQECHGVDGQGAGRSNGPEGKFAKLAGQYPEYILKQIRDFRSGARKHDLMAIMAGSVDDDDVLDIAAYFAAQAPMKGEPARPSATGRKLYQEGDAGRGIAACASCHGAEGRGLRANGFISPAIGGQEWLYLDKQLREWRSGDRRNSGGGVMNLVTQGLTDEDIVALADYISAL